MNLFKFLPQKLLPGIIRGAVKAYHPPANGNGRRSTGLITAGNANANRTGLAPLAGMMSEYLVPSVQARWLGASISWYTPQMVEYIYRQALAGDLQSQWEMFDMMESTWPELSKCENELKDAVCDLLGDDPGRPHLAICPAGGDTASDEAKRRAAIVDAALRSMRPRPEADENGLEGTLRDIMDARFKGLAVLEIDWELRSLSVPSPLGGEGEGEEALTVNAQCPRATRWVHPSWYGYPFGPGNERLLLKLGGLRPDNQYTPPIKPLPMGGNLPPVQSPMNFYGAGDFAEFPENKFIVAVSKSKSGHPLGGATLHILAWYWAAMNFSLEWFLNFAQLFGQPIRWATYDPNMDEGDQAKLELLLQNMGTSAWGMFPEGITIELKEAAMRGQDNPQMALTEMANKAARNLILRQSLTSDTGDKGSGSRALGTVHETVLDNVKLACGRWACGSLNQLIRYITILNFGNDQFCPEAKIIVPDEDESESTATSLQSLATAGLEPDDEALPVISGKMGYTVRRKAVTEANKGNEAIDPNAPPGKLAARNASGTSVKNPLPFLDAKTPALAAAFRGSRAPILALLEQSQSAEEFQDKLKAHYRDWNNERITAVIEEALQLAAATGAGNAATQTETAK